MLSIEKIEANLDPHIINTINECVRDQDVETLERWLTDCKKEIEFRQSQKMNTYSLHCEKYYLQTVLNIP